MTIPHDCTLDQLIAILETEVNDDPHNVPFRSYLTILEVVRRDLDKKADKSQIEALIVPQHSTDRPAPTPKKASRV